MKLIWSIEKQDVEKVNHLIIRNSNMPFYKQRLLKNIQKQGLIADQESIWKSIIVCLLTSQQNSSAESPISKFARQTPFPLDLATCRSKSENLERFIAIELKNFGGIRFYNRIANLLTKNYEYLERSNWEIFKEINTALTKDFISPSLQIKAERECAGRVQENLKGYGPKQSRNLLQMLGLTMYEIPIDSRITNWLNSELHFPLTVSVMTLQDVNFYHFVSDAIQSLCEKVDIMPCLFDAAVFVEGDKGDWTLENSFF